MFTCGYYNNLSVFWCKSVIFDLRNNNNNDLLSCKRIRQWRHILVSITSNPSKTTRVWTRFRESGKNSAILVSLKSLIFYVMINDFFFCYLKQKSRRPLHFVSQTGIVRFLLLFEQHGVKLLITSFWDTQYSVCFLPMDHIVLLPWIQTSLS